MQLTRHKIKKTKPYDMLVGSEALLEFYHNYRLQTHFELYKQKSPGNNLGYVPRMGINGVVIVPLRSF